VERCVALGEVQADVTVLGSRKKLEPGTAATPTSRASQRQNSVSLAKPKRSMSTIT
jgi:hypothetical protein